MKQFQHLLGKLAEEGCEIGQAAYKASILGPFTIEPGQPYTNYERCHFELDDLMAIIEELNEKHDFNYVPNRERIEAKKIKVRKFMDYSISLGLTEAK